jgi:hypothetical protein
MTFTLSSTSIAQRSLRGISRLGCVALVMASLFGQAAAQTTSTESQAASAQLFESNVFGVGLAASLCSGMGLSFKQHFANIPLSYQVTGGVWKTSELKLYDAGFEIQYDLSMSSNRLYAVVGAGYYYSGKNTNELEGPSRFGAGIGYEIPMSTQIGVSANLMLTVFSPKGDILPLPSVGAHIYFK